MIDTIQDRDQMLVSIDAPSLNPDTFATFYQENETEFDHLLKTKGAIKFRNVQIKDMHDFKKAVDGVASDFVNYIDGNSPRTKVSDAVYTSTEFDPTQKITMHHELSYSSNWPGKLFFTCLTPAVEGGETLLADGREMINKIDSAVVDKIREHGLIYYRNLHGGVGMGPSWQHTFETEDKQQVEAYCQNAQTDLSWGEDDLLTLKQYRKGIIIDELSGDEVWFNQLDQFHPAHLDEEYLDVLQGFYGEEEHYPTYVTYGDGSRISDETVHQILEGIESVTHYPAWDTNEILIVNNGLIAHGRNSFLGDRKVLVTMTQ